MAQMLAGARTGRVEFSLFDPAYYEKAADRAAAIFEILNTKDFEAFLEASGYPEREAF
ncbi:MAG TPA: hypothetical protein VMN36_15405 [Verrucomicrobiales bacterium]|nr:hypothetical protein [Verrucomicrobiales bacterium]